MITAPPGVVAEGVEWSDGTVAVRWLEDPPSTVVWGSMEAFLVVFTRSGAPVRIDWGPTPR